MAGFVSKGTCTWCCLRQPRDKQISAPAARAFTGYSRGLAWVQSCTQPRQSQQHLTLPRLCPCNSFLCGNGVDRVTSPWLSGSSLRVNQQPRPLNGLLEQILRTYNWESAPLYQPPCSCWQPFFLKDSTRKWYHAGFAFLCLPYFTYILPSRFHIVASDMTSLFLKAE